MTGLRQIPHQVTPISPSPVKRWMPGVAFQRNPFALFKFVASKEPATPEKIPPVPPPIIENLLFSSASLLREGSH